MSESISLREKAYLDVLQWGLILLRDFADRIELCRIEADHLHNIPSLLHEPNERRHEYYILGERSLYLERLRDLGLNDYLEQVAGWYSEPWAVLAQAANVTLVD